MFKKDEMEMIFMMTAKKYNKIIACFVVFAFMLTLIPVNSFASEGANEKYIDIQVDENGNPTQETINEIAEVIEFVMEEVVKTDSEGNVVGFDADKLIERYGHSPDMDKLVQILNESSSCGVITRADFGTCVKNALIEAFGVNIIADILDGGIIDLIARKAYKEAAELVAKAIVRLGGTPASLAVIVSTIIYSTYKCYQ